MFAARNILLAIVIILAASAYISNLNPDENFSFAEEDVIRITMNNVGTRAGISETIKAIHADFKQHYPDSIVSADDLKFSFLCAGGWTSAILILHASPSELLLIFGTALDTSGHSGRHWLNKTDIVFNGEMSTWKEGTYEAYAYRTGGIFRYNSGEAHILNFKANTWKVSYMRGFVAFSLPFISTDYMFCNQDYLTLFRIYSILFKEGIRRLASIFVKLF